LVDSLADFLPGCAELLVLGHFHHLQMQKTMLCMTKLQRVSLVRERQAWVSEILLFLAIHRVKLNKEFKKD
jgi:hypothetical protein